MSAITLLSQAQRKENQPLCLIRHVEASAIASVSSTQTWHISVTGRPMCHFPPELVSSQWLTAPFPVMRSRFPGSLILQFLLECSWLRLTNMTVERRVWRGGAAQENLSTFTLVKILRVWWQSVRVSGGDGRSHLSFVTLYKPVERILRLHPHTNTLSF